MADIGANVARIRARIAEAAARGGRRADDVLLVAVTKTVGLDRIREGVACGLRVFGENRVQEAREKVSQVPGVSWHLIGSLQRNKVKEALRLFQVIHSVDSLALAEDLSRRALQEPGHPVEVLVQVNISREPQKHGVAPEAAIALVSAALRLPGVRLRGLMGMAPLVARPEDARPFFRELRELRDRVREAHAFSTGQQPPGAQGMQAIDAQGAQPLGSQGPADEVSRGAQPLGSQGPADEVSPAVALADLSMGMTDDFEVAIEEGSTMVRIGRALFA